MGGFDLGSIRATMGLDESGFTRGLLNAKASAEIFGSTIANLVNNPLLGTISIFKDLAVGSARLVKDTANVNQEFVRMAERTGVSVEALSSLRLAYDELGLSSQDIEKTFTELAKRIDETRTSEDARLRFRQLGVQITDTEGKLRSIDDIFDDVADGLAQTGDATRRMALAQQLFGDSGQRLISVVGKGSEALDEMRRKADDLGYVIGTEAATQSDRLATALHDVTAEIGGLKGAVATGFIEGFAGELTDADLSSRELAKTVKDSLVPAAKDLGESLGIIAKTLKELLPLLDAMNKLGLTRSPISKVGDIFALGRSLSTVGSDEGYKPPPVFREAWDSGLEIGSRIREHIITNNRSSTLRQIRALE